MEKIRRLSCIATGIAFALGTWVAAVGCRSYHWDNVMHPQIQTIAVGEAANPTDEPSLAILLRKALAEQVMRDGSVTLATRDAADVVIQSRIISYDIPRISAVDMYEVSVTVAYEVVIPSQGGRVVIPEKSVTGTVQFPETPDLNINRQSGLQQAVNQAALKIIASITEAW